MLRAKWNQWLVIAILILVIAITSVAAECGGDYTTDGGNTYRVESDTPKIRVERNQR